MKGKRYKSRSGTPTVRNKSYKLAPRPPESASPGKRPRTSSQESTKNRDGEIWSVDLSQLCATASRSDLRSVHSCLLEEPDGSATGELNLTKGLKSLMPSTNVAKALHALLFREDYSEATGAGSIHFSNIDIIKQEYGSAVRSLLLLPPWSVTPWNAISDSISAIQKGTIGGTIGGAGQTRILTYIADISMFLNSVGSINDSNVESNFDSGQCERLRSLFHQIIEPLFQLIKVDEPPKAKVSFPDEANGTFLPQKNLYYELLMELLPTILSAVRRLDQRATLKKDNLEGNEKRCGDKRYLEEGEIGMSLYPDMMHALFPINCTEKSKVNGAQYNIESKEREIRPEMVLYLITASYDLDQHCHMRPSHWLIMHTKITSALHGDNHLGKEIPICDLPVLVQRVFVSIEAASTSTLQSNTEYLTHQKYVLSNTEQYSGIHDGTVLFSWYTLLINIYLASSKCHKTLGKVEAVLKSTMSNLSSRIASLFLDFTVQEGTYPDVASSFPLWVRANMLLIIYQSQRNGLYSVCELISNAVGNASGSGVNMIHESLNALLTLPFIDQSLIASSSIYEKRNNDKELSCLEMDRVRIYLKNISYAHDGNIGSLRKEGDSLSESDIAKIFSAFVKLVHGSLFLGNEEKRSRNMSGGCVESHTSERAQMWVNVAFTLMKSMGEQLNHSIANSFLFATSILVVVFWEVPSSRISVVRDLKNSISGSLGGNNTARSRLELKLDYCLVLSVMVKSANPQPRVGHQQIQACIDEMDDYLLNCLSPIANLLTCSNMTAVSPTALILELMHALSSLTVGREAILAMVRTYSQIPFGSRSFWLTHSIDDGIAGQDRMSLVVEGLICLIRDDRRMQKTQDDITILDDAGLEALCSITNLLVCDRPTLPFQARRLLLQKLLAVTEEGVIHQWTQLRLMGAALVAYLGYFRSTSDFSSEKISLQFNDLQFVPQNSFNVLNLFADNGDSVMNMNEHTSIREDLPSLTRLILCLLKSDSDKSRTSKRYPSSPVKVNEEDTQALFDIIIPRKRVPVESKASRRQKALSDKILMPIAFSCVGAVLNYLVKDDFHRNVNNQNNGNTFSMAMGSCVELRKALCITEKKQWSNHFQFQQTSKRGRGGKALVPSWVKSFSSTKLDFFNRKCSVHNLRSISLILSSLCSIMSGFFLSLAYVPVSKNKKRDMVQVRKLFRLSHSVNILLDLKRNLVTKKVLGDSFTNRNTSDEGSVRALESSEQEYYSVVQFFDCSRDVLQKTLFNKDTSHCNNILAVVSFMVPAIADYCRYIDLTLRRTSYKSIEREFHHTLQSIWDFYTIICSENGSIHFIDFLGYHCLNRNHSVELKLCNKKKCAPSLVESITSHDDVDNYVRQLRSSILTCLRGVFSIITKSVAQNKNKERTALYVTRPYDIDFMFCVRAIYRLSRDLYSGLYGHSSGITKSIYELYIKIIEEASKSVFEGCGIFFATLTLDGGGLKQVQEVKKMCQSASILLWNTVCNFDVIYPYMFKSSVQSSIWYLPQVVRRIDRLLLPPSPLTLQQLSNGQNMDNGYLAAAMLHQCLEALQIELKLIKKEKYGSKQNKQSDKRSEQEEKALVDSAFIVRPSNITIPRRCVNVRFPNAKLRNWTFSCSIMIAERVWMESRTLMIQARSTPNSKCAKEVMTNKGLKQVKVKWRSTTKHYASKRRIEVRSILNIINSLFVPMKEEIMPPSLNSRGQGISILAELLPQLGKQRLCSCLEKISTTLNHSLKYISQWWREVHLLDVPLSHEDKKYTDIVMAEALACLLAWLSPSESSLSIVDFTIGARTWYSMEKKRESLLNSNLNNSKPGEDPILGRITKLLLHIEELDLIFHKTYSALKGEDFQANVKNNLLNLDKMVFDVLEGTHTQEEKDEKCLKTFSQIVCEHTERINMMKSSAAKILSGTESKEKEFKISDVSFQRSEDTRKNKRRSRNTVVDNWLELDEEWNKDGENNNDSYFDLEDFLVEG